MHDATERVTHWSIDVTAETPMVEMLATVDDVRHYVGGHVRWDDGTPGPAVELEDIDLSTVD